MSILKYPESAHLYLAWNIDIETWYGYLFLWNGGIVGLFICSKCLLWYITADKTITISDDITADIGE